MHIKSCLIPPSATNIFRGFGQRIGTPRPYSVPTLAKPTAAVLFDICVLNVGAEHGHRVVCASVQHGHHETRQYQGATTAHLLKPEYHENILQLLPSRRAVFQTRYQMLSLNGDA
jgi:hypothetical protein